jgi:hypothetical protein
LDAPGSANIAAVPGTMTLLDVRLYRIRPGRRDEFHTLVRDETIPLARRHGHLVVDFGPSWHDEETYYLIRAFPDDQARRLALDDLYGSEEWLLDYDRRVMAFIESYQTAVIPTTSDVVDALVAAAESF